MNEAAWAVETVLVFVERWAEGKGRDREVFEEAAPLVRALVTGTAAQRPPDPAAPDLRGLLREAREQLREHMESGSYWAHDDNLIARIDAALDEKQVGAAPHSTEET